MFLVSLKLDESTVRRALQGLDQQQWRRCRFNSPGGGLLSSHYIRHDPLFIGKSLRCPIGHMVTEQEAWFMERPSKNRIESLYNSGEVLDTTILSRFDLLALLRLQNVHDARKTDLKEGVAEWCKSYSFEALMEPYL